MADLAKITTATQRARRPLRVGRVIERLHMAKHFALTTTTPA